MSSKKIKKELNLNESDNKRKKFLVIPFILIIVLLLILIIILLINRKDNNLKCDAPIEKEIIKEKEPTYQLINYQGFKFKMPLDWSFVGHNNNYEISNDDESLYITLDYIEEDYSIFITDEYQKRFLENIQTSSNTRIELSKYNDKYYYYEGLNNEYNYLIIAIGNNEKVILIKAQFINKLSFDKLKQGVIDFSISNF